MYIHTSAVYQQTIFSGAQPACIPNVAPGSSPPQRAPFLANKTPPYFRPPLSAAVADEKRKTQKASFGSDGRGGAMAPLGFTEKQVKEAVKGLLKVYDGNDAWPVIEESSYTLLLEATLNDVEVNQERGTEVGNDSKDNCLEEGTSDIASNIVLSDIQQHEERKEDATNPSVVVAEPACPVEKGASSEIIINEGGAEVLPTETMENVSCKTARDSETGLQVTVKSPSLILTPAATNAHPSRRRWPCYGWIDNDEDEEPNDFMYLNPA